jgi:hypothetical protein
LYYDTLNILKNTVGDTCLTHILISWSRVLLEKLTGSQIVKKFPAFYERKGSLLIYKCPAPLLILSLINPIHSPIPLPDDPSYQYLLLVQSMVDVF